MLTLQKNIIIFCDGEVFLLDRGHLMGASISEHTFYRYHILLVSGQVKFYFKTIVKSSEEGFFIGVKFYFFVSILIKISPAGWKLDN